MGSIYSPSGPILEFEVAGDRNNFFDLQKIFLEVNCKIVQSSETDLKYDAAASADITKTDSPYFCNDVLHSLFSDWRVSANRQKNSNANGNYAHKSFNETDFSHKKVAKNTWLACQIYSYEENPLTLSTAEVNRRKLSVRQSAECTFYGKIAVDFFTCDRHLLSGVTLRIAFRRSIDEFVRISDDAAKQYKVKIVEANLYVRTMTFNDAVVSAIEKTFFSPASYPYLETLTKTFLASTGLHNWKQEIYLRKNQSAHWRSAQIQMKFFWVTTGKIHFIFENSTLSRFIYIETVCQWQIVQYLQLTTDVFTLIQYRI